MANQVNPLKANIRAVEGLWVEKSRAARKYPAADNSPAAGAADNSREAEAGKPGTPEES
jgi:hypothetical protein